MSNQTISIYITKRYIIWVMSLLFFGASILFVSDLLELVRRTRDFEGYEFLNVTKIAILRMPSLLEQLFPFVVLLSGITTFLSLNRYHELTMIKTAGLSVWQIIKPVYIITLIFGIIGVIGFNPISMHLRDLSDRTGEHLFALTGTYFLSSQNDIWIRQDSNNGEFVFFATSTNSTKSEFFDVSITYLNEKYNFGERIIAKNAILKDNFWYLSDVTVYSTNSAPEKYPTLEINTFLTSSEINERIAEPEVISILNLPKIINLAERAGLPAYRYSLQFHSILSLPILLSSMILIAASVSMRYSKMMGTGRIYIIGILAGFAFYLIAQFIKNLGSAGMIPPFLAAWSPGVIATLTGILLLLYREEG